MKITRHSPEYQKVLRSARWKKLRKARMWSAGWRCERCRCAGTERTLELHHKTYERLGNERDDDLELLCQSCHMKADVQRKHENINRHWDRRIEGWAYKKYGDMWQWPDWDVVTEEFDRWLERQQGW